MGEEIAPARSTLLGPVAYDLPIEANNWVEAEVDFLVRERRRCRATLRSGSRG
jgi:hypothetical protein